MKKLKIYLDTSVISHLDAPDVPEKMKDTWRLWRAIEADQFIVALSEITLSEVDDCSEPKRSSMRKNMSNIDFEMIAVNSDMLEIADSIIHLGILREKSIDDSQHIAAAIIGGCDAIVSWNFKHIVNHRTIQGVKAITALAGYPDMLIYTPTMLLGGEDDD